MLKFRRITFCGMVLIMGLYFLVGCALLCNNEIKVSHAESNTCGTFARKNNDDVNNLLCANEVYSDYIELKSLQEYYLIDDIINLV